MSDTNEMRQEMSASQIVMDAIEQFGESEPDHAIVIYTSQNTVTIVTNARSVTALGMLRLAEDMVVKKSRRDDA